MKQVISFVKMDICLKGSYQLEDGFASGQAFLLKNVRFLLAAQIEL